MKTVRLVKRYRDSQGNLKVALDSGFKDVMTSINKNLFSLLIDSISCGFTYILSLDKAGDRDLRASQIYPWKFSFTESLAEFLESFRENLKGL